MCSDLEKIESFIQAHHVMSLATTYRDEVSACSLFYVYDAEENSFIVASSEETMHIKHIKENANIAANILLETQNISRIKGLQIRGLFTPLTDTKLQLKYFARFPYALALKPKLWKIKVALFKLTDNSLGFGKKIIWENATS